MQSCCICPIFSRMKITLEKTFLFLFLMAGCATQSYLKGVTPGGEKVYLGTTDIQSTEAYQKFQQSAHSEVDKQQYLFARLKASEGLEFFHDGTWYDKIAAYRGGLWLMRHRYKKGQDTRAFIKKYIEYSEAGKLHLARYPDGTIQLGGAVLYNELDLLEETLQRQ